MDQRSRTSDYYKNLRKRIKLNSNYEQAINQNTDRLQNGVTLPPPPQENFDKDLQDLNSQKQKAFNNIKTILTKHDETTKFLNKLDDSEIMPFNSYFEKFKNTAVGIDIKEADFLIKLWDTFKKKILLTDKETPILGTDLEIYKQELQIKADNIIEYAGELGLNVNRVRNALEYMVNENDSESIDKFYYKLLTNGPQAARTVLEDKFDAKEVSEESRPIIVEEVIREEAVKNINEEIVDLKLEREKYIDPLMAIVLRDRVLKKKDLLMLSEQSKGYNERQLKLTEDKNIIENNAPRFINKIIELNKGINKKAESLGINGIAINDILKDIKIDSDTKKLLDNYSVDNLSEYFDLSGIVGIESNPELESKAELDSKDDFDTEAHRPDFEEKEVSVLSNNRINFDSMPNEYFGYLIALLDAKKKQIFDLIMAMVPSGKFEFNGIKYNMNRNPPSSDKQLEYILANSFYKEYGIDIHNLPIKELFRQLRISNRYSAFLNERDYQLKQIEEKNYLLEKQQKDIEEKELAELTEKEKKKYLNDLEIEAAKIIENVYNIINKVEKETSIKILNKVADIINNNLKKLGLNLKFNSADIAPVFKIDNIGKSIDKIIELIQSKFEHALTEIEQQFNQLQILSDERVKLLEKSKTATKKNKINKQIFDNETKIAYIESYLVKNNDFYIIATNVFKNLPLIVADISSYVSFLEQDKSEIKIKMAKTENELKPLKDAYERILNILNDNGIIIMDLEQAVEKIYELNKIKPSARKINLTKKLKNPAKMENLLIEKTEIKKNMSKEKKNKLKSIFNKKVTDAKEKQREKRLSLEENHILSNLTNINDNFQPKENRFTLLGETDEEKGYTPEGSGNRIRKDRLSKIKFGKYHISGKGLDSGILDIRTDCNRTSFKIGRTPISSRLEKAINYVIKNNDIDIDSFESLNSDEKKLFLHAIEISDVKLNSIPFDIFKKFNSNSLNKELDILIDRYHVLVGELGAGNNAPEILRELRGILFKLLEKKKIDRTYANEILLMINAVQ